MIRKMTEEDRETVGEWIGDRFAGYGNINMLPSLGYMVDEKCAFFVYTVDNAPVCFVEWIVTDPNITPRESVSALKEAANEISNFASYMKESEILTYTILSNAKLVKIFERVGFTVGCKNETTLIFGGL